MPPLRERREDVVGLAHYFLERYRGVRAAALSPAAVDALLAYHWPGNVRELERVMERAVALAGSDTIEAGRPSARAAGRIRRHHSAVDARPRHDARMGRAAMRGWSWSGATNNKRRACRELGISYHTLQAHLNSSRRRSIEPGPL